MSTSDAVLFPPQRCTRRAVLQSLTAGAMAASARLAARCGASEPSQGKEPRPWISVRGIYGGFPREILQRGETPADYGVNAVWVGSGSLDAAEIERYHSLGLQVFAEFNSLHAAEYLKDRPDA